MTIIHQAGVLTASRGQSTGGAWSPNNLGRISTNGDLCYSNHSDDQVAPNDATSTSDAAIWVYRTAGNIYIRCGVSGTGNTLTEEKWYDTGGTSQGDPGPETGTGTSVFDIGTDAGVSVNIYNATDTTTTGTPTFQGIGTSYTSDDKTTFFTPAEDTKYGREILTSATETSNSGIEIEEGNFDIQITFRKTGETDYTITYKCHARARAFVEP